MLFFGLILSLIPIIGMLMGEMFPFWTRLVLSPLLLVGLYLIGSALYLVFGRRLSIFNPATGQSWQQTRIFGVPITISETSAIEIIPWMGAPARVLRYPASVAELCRNRYAPALFSTALLQLVAQGVVAIGLVKIYRKGRNPSQVYVLVPGEAYGQVDIQGKFERRLVDVVGQALSEAAEFELDGNQTPRTQRSVLCLEDAVRMVFGLQQRDSERFDVDRFVGEEAVELGLGEFSGNQFLRFTPGNNAMGKISLDLRSIDLLHHDFWTTQPDHATDLLAQIDIFMHAMLPAGPKVAARSTSRA